MSYPKYLDASAATKLVIPEDMSNDLLQFFRPQNGFVMTPFCFYETLSTLKAKWQGRKNSSKQIIRITDRQYHDSCYLLLSYVRSRKIEVEEDLILSSMDVQPEVERLARVYRLDFSDALQLLTLKQGCYRSFTGASSALLISDDGLLVESARKEGLRVWYLKDPSTKPQ